ncbi:MAG: hypothetical protein JXB88_11865 [Spirochaetales bacterium]|nr:hypothetical protein [Spirochaetales bacterium]
MKNSILLPALLLFYSIILLILFTVIFVFFLVISNHVIIQHLSMHTIFYYITSSLVEVLPATILCAIIITFFHILKKPGNRILSYLFMVITATILLAGGTMIFSLITPEKLDEPHTLSDLIQEKSFTSIDETIFFTGEIEGNTLYNNLLADISPRKKTQVLSYAPEAYGRQQDGNLEIAFAGNIRRRIIIENDMQKARSFDFDFFTGELLSSYSILSGELRKLTLKGNVEFYLFCFAFSFLFITTNMFMRISKWPLFNFIFLLFIITGIFFLYKLFNSIILAEFTKLIPDSGILPLIPVIGMFILGIFFFLFDIIFIPFHFKDEEL